MTATSGAGPLADEAAAFVDAALGWVKRAASAVSPDAPECTSCPLCRAVGALREPSPELSDRLTTVATDLATALAAGLTLAFDHQHHRAGGAPGAPPTGSAASGVEHIDIA